MRWTGLRAFLATIAILASSATTTGVAAAQTGGVREVSATERGVIPLQTRLRYTTMVVLPEGEEILDVLCGDRDFWVISATHNIAHVKPAKAGAETNLNLVTSSGAIYSFMLTEKSSPPDIKVYVQRQEGATTGKPKGTTPPSKCRRRCRRWRRRSPNCAPRHVRRRVGWRKLSRRIGSNIPRSFSFRTARPRYREALLRPVAVARRRVHVREDRCNGVAGIVRAEGWQAFDCQLSGARGDLRRAESDRLRVSGAWSSRTLRKSSWSRPRSTWRPVWEALEQHWRPHRRARDGAPAVAGTLHLAQAQSNRGPGGRKRDFPDAERLVKRLVAQELTLSFVPDTEQRLWRTVMRRRYQITRNRVQLHNRLEALLEEAHIKVSSIVSALLGISARRMLQALAEGETDSAALAKLAAPRLRATPEQLCDAFQACPTLHPVYRPR